MSPEQAKSEPLDHRSDLYSLAVCMYEILTGERLFIHAGLTTSADEIYSQPVPMLSKKVPGLTPDLDAIMQKALALNPDERFQTAGEFQEALMRCAHRNGLLMSAPELATELRDACGAIDSWREDADDDDLGYVQRAGTEIYDVDDEEDEDDEDLGIGPMSVHSIAAKMQKPKAAALPKPRPKTEVDKFHGVELTSIINMIDLEQEGAKPLVDLDQAPPAPRQLDSGPRQLGSDPNLVGPGSTGGAPLVRQDTPPPLEQAEMLPTMPRAAPTYTPSKPVEQTAKGQRLDSQPKPAGFHLKPWMVILVIVVAAAIVTMIVALSGPSVGAGK
jgi:serine/threonine protein kinase